MRAGWFLLGVMVGLALAPMGGRVAWRRLRDRLARVIDTALCIGVRDSAPQPSGARRAF